MRNLWEDLNNRAFLNARYWLTQLENMTRKFKFWNLKSQILEDEIVGVEAKKLFADAQNLIAEIVANNKLKIMGLEKNTVFVCRYSKCFLLSLFFMAAI